MQPRSSSWQLLLAVVAGLDNGRGLKPTQGWSSWKVYAFGVSQASIEATMRALALQHEFGDGLSSSLVELGYVEANLDDGWQACGAGVNGSFHDTEGNPLINSKFPNMSAMTMLGRSLGLRSGFYMVSSIIPNYDHS